MREPPPIPCGGEPPYGLSIAAFPVGLPSCGAAGEIFDVHKDRLRRNLFHCFRAPCFAACIAAESWFIWLSICFCIAVAFCAA